MKILFYNTSKTERPPLEKEAPQNISISLTDLALSINTVLMSKSFDAISIGSSDEVSDGVLDTLFENGIRYIAIRAADNQNIDLKKASQLGIVVANVPFYPPAFVNESSPGFLQYMADTTFYNLECYKKDLTSGNELTVTNNLGQATIYMR